MKKLMGVSIVAMLAVMPMMANAAANDPVATQYKEPTGETASAPVAQAGPKYATVGIVEGDQGHIASTAYVKGAYNSAIVAINKVATDAAGNLSGAAGNGLAFDTTAKKFNADLDTAAGLGFDTAADGSRKIQIKTGNGVQFDANGAIAAKVNTSMLTVDSTNGIGIADAGVDSTQLKDSAVISAKIADSAVTTNKIADLNVARGKIADYAVDSSKLDTNAVTTDKLDTGAVTETKLGTGAVTETKLGTGAVTETKLGDSAVTTAKINDGAVTASKIGANAVTYEKLDTGLVQTGVRSSVDSATDAAGYAKWNDNKTVASEKAVAAAIATATDDMATTAGVVATIGNSKVSIYTTWDSTATTDVNITAATYSSGVGD